MNVLPREKTAPWEADCRRCGIRTLGAFSPNGAATVLDAEPVYGGDIELRPLEVGFRALRVEAAGDTERYAVHQCAKPEPEPVARTAPPVNTRLVMPFGKHRGTYVADLPSGYIVWCLENLTFREPLLKRAMESVLDGERE